MNLKEKHIIQLNKTCNLSELEGINKELWKTIKQSRIETNTDLISTLLLPSEKSGELKDYIKSNQNWNKYFKEILKIYNYKIDYNEAKAAINIPWWSNVLSDFTEIEYDEHSEQLYIIQKESHSFIQQIVRKGILEEEVDIPSVMGIIVSEDNKIILGERGGLHFAGAIMTIPAGYVNYFEDNVLYQNFWKELKEELGLKKEEIQDYSLISYFPIKQIKSNTHFIFFMQCKYNFEEINKKWENNAKDCGEHRQLIAIDNSRKSIEEILLKKKFPPSGEEGLKIYKKLL